MRNSSSSPGRRRARRRGGERVADADRRSHAPEGVVLVHQRQAEDGGDGLARDGLDDAAVALHLEPRRHRRRGRSRVAASRGQAAHRAPPKSRSRCRPRSRSCAHRAQPARRQAGKLVGACASCSGRASAGRSSDGSWFRIAWCNSRRDRLGSIRALRRAPCAPAGRRRAPRPACRFGRAPASAGGEAARVTAPPAPAPPTRRRARPGGREPGLARSAPRDRRGAAPRAGRSPSGRSAGRRTRRGEGLARATAPRQPCPLPAGAESAPDRAHRARPQQVAGRLRLQPLAADQLAQLGDVHLERLDRRVGRVVLPEGVDQAIARDDPVRMQQEHGEQRPLLGAGDVDRPAVLAQLERSENPVLHCGAHPFPADVTPPRAGRQSPAFAGALPALSRVAV